MKSVDDYHQAVMGELFARRKVDRNFEVRVSDYSLKSIASIEAICGARRVLSESSWKRQGFH